MTTALEPSRFPAPLRDIAAKVRDGERLDEAEALVCFETPHVLHLGRLASAVRRPVVVAVDVIFGGSVPSNARNDGSTSSFVVRVSK